MQIEKYSDRLKTLIQSAQTLALRDGHQQLTPLHVLKALLEALWIEFPQQGRQRHLEAGDNRHLVGLDVLNALADGFQGRKIAGVCLGFAEYFDIDPVLVRVVWVLCTLFGLAGLIAYAAAWIVVPEEPRLLTAGSEVPENRVA